MGSDYTDSSVLYYKNKWWLFTCSSCRNDILKLFYADNLIGPWVEHSANPIIVNNPHISRCGGRVLVYDNKIIRYAQDDYPVYGNQLRAFEITKLTTTNYEEKGYFANPVLRARGIGWNRSGMHSVDPHFNKDGSWIACVDGNARYIGLQRNARNKNRLYNNL